jgi:ETC complex I subunit conserved region
MHVRIFKPAKTAMQSGRSRTKSWCLEAVSMQRKDPDALMGWVASKDTLNEINLAFDSKESAITYAEHNGWSYDIIPEHTRNIKPKNYSDNFIPIHIL